ncbi:ABC transporter permease [Acuticoccus yangtzensis]|uniref:ABC transporter permease n=1 Tax=Acuticoccus yangtzensis TaxID=1443441 RepID=UPI000949A225|nr:ABC transporter permease [Acuticoccus yangtzensis]ORE95523.1 polysialic acid transport protein [Stappia sp. 22II-S9-Z10]
MASVGEAVSRQAGVIYSVAMREAQTRNVESPVGVFSMVLEPVAMLTMMTIIFTYVRLRTGGMGDYIMVFLMTGIVPLSVFRSSVTGGDRTYNRMKRLLVLPNMQPIDLVIGGILLQLLAMMGLYTLITFFFHYFYGTDTPEYFWLSMLPAMGNCCIAFGFCMLNMVIKLYFKFWGTLFGILTGPLNIVSGMFFTAETLPPAMLKYLYYNPFMHSTELTRSFYFPEYTSHFFDIYYYGGWCAGGIVVGLLLERAYRYRLLHATV